MIAVYALIGNDVCNGHLDTLADMTTPEAMQAASHDTLVQLEKTLPKGSHVFLMGLADGRVLYETMADRVRMQTGLRLTADSWGCRQVHPLGALHNNVLTKDVYAFLNCLSISPCRGWMNKNGTCARGLRVLLAVTA